MPRYYRVKGKPGFLVYDDQLSMERPVGMRLLPPGDRPKNWVARADLFEPVEMTVRNSKTFREARDTGKLDVIAGPVVADTAATAKFEDPATLATGLMVEAQFAPKKRNQRPNNKDGS